MERYKDSFSRSGFMSVFPSDVRKLVRPDKVMGYETRGSAGAILSEGYEGRDPGDWAEVESVGNEVSGSDGLGDWFGADIRGDCSD